MSGGSEDPKEQLGGVPMDPKWDSPRTNEAVQGPVVPPKGTTQGPVE